MRTTTTKNPDDGDQAGKGELIWRATRMHLWLKF
jgi:hypothetical protein